jgi:CRP/FNR family transcriptional regulator, cyclic AMP receptor protein
MSPPIAAAFDQARSRPRALPIRISYGRPGAHTPPGNRPAHNRGRVGQWDRETPVARLERDAKRAALLASPLFDAMQPAELDAILKFALERQLRRGQMIFQRGDNGSSLMAVLRGRVRISTVSGEGKEVTLNVINPGEIFGEIALLDGQPRSADATAIEDTLLLVVERRHFLPFLRQNEDLFLRLLSVLCTRLRRTSTALEEIALFDLPVRLARVLLKLADDYGRPGSAGTRIDLKLSQRDLSNLVASSRESVNKQLRVWRETSVVDLEDGFIVLRQPVELKRLTDVR